MVYKYPIPCTTNTLQYGQLHYYASVGGATRHTVVVVSFVHSFIHSFIHSFCQSVGQSVATISRSSLKTKRRNVQSRYLLENDFGCKALFVTYGVICLPRVVWVIETHKHETRWAAVAVLSAGQAPADNSSWYPSSISSKRLIVADMMKPDLSIARNACNTFSSGHVLFTYAKTDYKSTNCLLWLLEKLCNFKDCSLVL